MSEEEKPKSQPVQQDIPEVKASEEARKFTRDNIRRVPLASMNPAPYNPREITQEALEGLKFSLEQWGLVEVLVWNSKTGNLISGHQRYKILKDAGQFDAYACILELDPEEEVMLNIALNNPAIQGKFKEKGLFDLVKMLKSKKSPEAFRKSGLLALEKQLPLFDAPKPQEATTAPAPAPGGAKGTAPAPAPGTVAVQQPKPDVRLIQIFLSTEQHKEFSKALQVCATAMGCANATETIFKLVKMASAKLAPVEPEKPAEKPPEEKL